MKSGGLDLAKDLGGTFLSHLSGSHEPESAASVLRFISSHLTEDERADFGVQLLDAVRDEKLEKINFVLESWLVSIGIRLHPDSAQQAKEYENLMNSGELFIGANHLADA